MFCAPTHVWLWEPMCQEMKYANELYMTVPSTWLPHSLGTYTFLKWLLSHQGSGAAC